MILAGVVKGLRRLHGGISSADERIRGFDSEFRRGHHPLEQGLMLAEKGVEAVTPRAMNPQEMMVSTETTKGTACLPCTRGHLATCAAVLAEAMRFARSEGVAHPEVQDRVEACYEELNAWERFDVAPDKLQALPEAERQVMSRFIPRAREMRHHMEEIESVDALESVAAEARVLSTDLRLETLRLKGVDVDRVKQLADDVKTGRKTLEQAQAELQQ